METVEKAKKLIMVEYEVLPAVHNIEEAAAPDAPQHHAALLEGEAYEGGISADPSKEASFCDGFYHGL